MNFIKFYSCYLQQCLSVDLLSWIPSHGQKGPMNKVCPFYCPEVFLELAVQFFLQLSMMLGAHVVLCMTEPDFLKIILFAPKSGKIGQAQRSLNVQKNLVINFLSICSKMKVHINCFILRQISYLRKLWFLIYGPKCFWPIRSQDF